MPEINKPFTNAPMELLGNEIKKMLPEFSPFSITVEPRVVVLSTNYRDPMRCKLEAQQQADGMAERLREPGLTTKEIGELEELRLHYQAIADGKKQWGNK